MKRFIISSLLACCLISVSRGDDTEFRPPAVPLVTFNPYLSIWSRTQTLTDSSTTHWTGRPHPLRCLIRIDGKTYRLMGADPADVPAFPQKSLTITPTQSIYEFDDSIVHVTLKFTTPRLPSSLDAMGQPLSYLTWTVSSVDHAQHTVSIYDSTSSLLAVNEPDQKVTWSRETMGPLTALKVGTVAQTTFDPAGDRVRIDWGYAYAVTPTAQSTAAISGSQESLSSFVQGGTLPAADDTTSPRAANDDEPVLAFVLDLGSVNAPVSRHIMVGYDEIYSIKFAMAKLQPYWRRNGATPSDMFQAAETNYASLLEKCDKFDADLTADMTKIGGAKYAALTGLAYRESIAGTGIAADANKMPLVFTKENTSNGDIATVDVIFPMEPIFIFSNPTLAKAEIVPVFDYAASSRWKFPNAPHDLGTYPRAAATGEAGEAMVVEESGNMIILADAIMQADNDTEFVTPRWPELTQWAKYLQKFGLDPGDQLCTDDFKGHLAHNANLSIKAIVALAAFGDMCKRRGDLANATTYNDMAKTDAQNWVQMAGEGDHYKLAFDKPHTWSQEYNLVWDRLLGLNVFPPEVAPKSIAYYLTKMNTYGLPLDSRDAGTKTDWTVWTATLADSQQDFESFIDPLYKFFNETTRRNPEADQFDTKKIDSDGMNSRPVIGGLFIKMISDAATWHKWAAMAEVAKGPWAGFPEGPSVTYVDPPASGDPATGPVDWHYTLDKPADDSWRQATFDDSTWKTGPSGFGHEVGPIHTPWTTDDIWIRRQVKVPDDANANYGLMVFHDEDFEGYINGVLAAHDAGYNKASELYEIDDAAKAELRPGSTVTFAVHCHQTINGQCIDVRLVKEGPPAAPKTIAP
jgi:hypothetical protein